MILALAAWTIVEIVLVLAIVAAGYGLWCRRARVKRRLARLGSPEFMRRRRGRAAEAELLRMALGDRELVERLIAAERRRTPTGDRPRWAVAAHKRWLADLR